MNYQEFILEVNKHRDDKLMYQYGERNKPENYLPKDPVKDAKKVKVAQIAPMKSNFIGTNMKSLPHMDLRGPGEKMMSVINQKRFYDSDYGKMQGGPPKGP